MATAPQMIAAPAGHPFRRLLNATETGRPGTEDNDLKLFVLSFTAFFVCIYSFIG